METFIVLGAPVVVFFDEENKKVLVKESHSRCFFLWLMLDPGPVSCLALSAL